MASISIMESLRTDIPEDIEKELFKNVMKRDWNKVIDIYKKYPLAHTLKITSSGQTALHIAISDHEYEDKVNNVKKLVEHIKRGSDPFEVLQLQTEKGLTPLHLAAAAGQ